MSIHLSCAWKVEFIYKLQFFKNFALITIPWTRYLFIIIIVVYWISWIYRRMWYGWGENEKCFSEKTVSDMKSKTIEIITVTRLECLYLCFFFLLNNLSPSRRVVVIKPSSGRVTRFAFLDNSLAFFVIHNGARSQFPAPRRRPF